MRRKRETYINIIPCHRGHFERYVDGSRGCVECSKLMTKKYEQKNKEKSTLYRKEWHKKPESIEKVRLQQYNWRGQNREKRMFSGAKSRAKRKGLEFNITLSDIIIPKYCPVFPELELLRNKGRVTFNSPTLDRIDNTKGYLKGNVTVISYKANRLKGDATYDELKRLLEYMKLES